MTDRSDALKALHDALIDAKKGYEKALELAKEPAHEALFRDAVALKSEAASTVSGALRADGVEPDADGSFMGMVHQTVVNIRGTFTGVDRGMLENMADGERRLAPKFDEARQAVDPSDPLHGALKEIVEKSDAFVSRLEAMARSAGA